MPWQAEVGEVIEITMTTIETLQEAAKQRFSQEDLATRIESLSPHNVTLQGVLDEFIDLDPDSHHLEDAIDMMAWSAEEFGEILGWKTQYLIRCQRDDDDKF